MKDWSIGVSDISNLRCSRGRRLPPTPLERCPPNFGSQHSFDDSLPNTGLNKAYSSVVGSKMSSYGPEFVKAGISSFEDLLDDQLTHSK
ncbi:unnamed protein product [Echinostoma caproni]|uniref:AGC-kinase C-terminal domain-containing protein n=1 Tax=Echinostoma caproni TaxID=27848 RepID=A0A183AAX5_9TREM|nr:unnamed protein product [Echinostoma caproni]